MGFVGAARVGRYGTRGSSVCRRTRNVAFAVAPRQIFDDYWVGGDVSEEAISELSPKSVMLLKTSAEEGVTADEVKQFCEEKGIDMKWVPVSPKIVRSWSLEKRRLYFSRHGYLNCMVVLFLAFRCPQADRELADEIVNLLAAQEKPVLIECSAGTRAGAALSIYMARENGFSFEEIREMALAKSMKWPEVPPLAEWVSQSV